MADTTGVSLQAGIPSLQDLQNETNSGINFQLALGQGAGQSAGLKLGVGLHDPGTPLTPGIGPGSAPNPPGAAPPVQGTGAGEGQAGPGGQGPSLQSEQAQAYAFFTGHSEGGLPGNAGQGGPGIMRVGPDVGPHGMDFAQSGAMDLSVQFSLPQNAIMTMQPGAVPGETSAATGTQQGWIAPGLPGSSSTSPSPLPVMQYGAPSPGSAGENGSGEQIPIMTTGGSAVTAEGAETQVMLVQANVAAQGATTGYGVTAQIAVMRADPATPAPVTQGDAPQPIAVMQLGAGTPPPVVQPGVPAPVVATQPGVAIPVMTASPGAQTVLPLPPNMAVPEVLAATPDMARPTASATLAPMTDPTAQITAVPLVRSPVAASSANLTAPPPQPAGMAERAPGIVEQSPLSLPQMAGAQGPFYAGQAARSATPAGLSPGAPSAAAIASAPTAAPVSLQAPAAAMMPQASAAARAATAVAAADASVLRPASAAVLSQQATSLSTNPLQSAAQTALQAPAYEAAGLLAAPNYAYALPLVPSIQASRPRQFQHLRAYRQPPQPELYWVSAGPGAAAQLIAFTDRRPIPLDTAPHAPLLACWRLDDTEALILSSDPADGRNVAELHAAIMAHAMPLALLRPGDGFSTWEGSPLWLRLAGIPKPAALGVLLAESMPGRVQVMRQETGFEVTWIRRDAPVRSAVLAGSTVLLDQIAYGGTDASSIAADMRAARALPEPARWRVQEALAAFRRLESKMPLQSAASLRGRLPELAGRSPAVLERVLNGEVNGVDALDGLALAMALDRLPIFKAEGALAS